MCFVYFSSIKSTALKAVEIGSYKGLLLEGHPGRNLDSHYLEHNFYPLSGSTIMSRWAMVQDSLSFMNSLS